MRHNSSRDIPGSRWSESDYQQSCERFMCKWTFITNGSRARSGHGARCDHRALVSAASAAACRQARLRALCTNKRQHKWQVKDQQERDGQCAAHGNCFPEDTLGLRPDRTKRPLRFHQIRKPLLFRQPRPFTTAKGYLAHRIRIAPAKDRGRRKGLDPPPVLRTNSSFDETVTPKRVPGVMP